ncbi:acid phosphatase/phosphotransferase [Salmonella enterica subsp. enterica serovar Choleraesuis]|nr:acid phosphatase/phosphotransferase [Salmonella enterica subsp. enterica serovar Choleraesuis]
MLSFKKSGLRIALAVALLSGSPALFAAPPAPVSQNGVTLEKLNAQYPIHWVSIEQIAADLEGRAPIDVGFDIDDTLLYSTPAFFHGKQLLSPDSNDYLKKSEFWEQLSNGWDAFSVPKKSAIALMKFHMDRGDRIWFITGRPMPESGKEKVTEQLAKDFAIPAARLNSVIFAGESKAAKVSHIREHHIALYYGDSDGDIVDAREAGAEGIRVLRPLNSSNAPAPVIGALGEKVLVNSDY